MLRKILQPFYTAYVVLIFVATLFAVLPFYLVLSLSNTAASRKMVWRLTWLWSWLWLRLTGMWVRRFGALPQGNQFVIVANHVSYLDPIVIYDVLPFYFRPLAKHEIKKVPLFGFIYAQIALLVDRSSIQSRAASMRAMQDALHYDCSVFMYPEGTFNESTDAMQAFYDGAFRLAIEAQVSILPIVFPDTKARWHYSAWWKMWPGKNRAYILEPISVQGLSLEDVPVLKEKVRAIMGDELMRQMEKSGK
jgi:1-acyl-sn-glycerol-3-phosphate acyltransferase